MTSCYRNISKDFCQSSCFSIVLSYLGQIQSMKLQQLSSFFYQVQIPKGSRHTINVKYTKSRLHFFKNDYLLIFNMRNQTKEKRKIKNLSALWDFQSIEVYGQIYITGGFNPNIKNYLRSLYRIDESKWEMIPLEDMTFERDAHGITSWKDRYIIVSGSWHVDNSAATSEMYDIPNNYWITLPENNLIFPTPSMIVIKDRYLYKFGGTESVIEFEMIDLEQYLKYYYQSMKGSINFEDSFGWQIIKIKNEMGKFALITGSYLHYLNEDQLMVLGYYSNLNEQPFIFDVRQNEFKRFHVAQVMIDMYGSNDAVQFDENSILIRPFVNSDEPLENVKIYQYFLKEVIVEKEEQGLSMQEQQDQLQEEDLDSSMSNEESYRIEKGHIMEVLFTKTIWDDEELLIDLSLN
ncbi:hypothetical protein FGO68_gene5513 [Halteria grandinella]|uniref:Kelch motif family protein n=1 Tax=Halteria grandinella TaxID=5974 RepID=A0A8J8NQB2_HALGN|nr:hypothetical protein FGO68_gene5513 [Halteria grandinella]